jgi:hypothetical protein
MVISAMNFQAFSCILFAPIAPMSAYCKLRHPLCSIPALKRLISLQQILIRLVERCISFFLSLLHVTSRATKALIFFFWVKREAALCAELKYSSFSLTAAPLLLSAFDEMQRCSRSFLVCCSRRKSQKENSLSQY